jgi:hypothetical protein
MIPYDDLVAALAAWRTRQGLPVAQHAAAAPQATSAPQAAATPQAAAAQSRSRGAPAAPPPAAPPPAARPGAARAAAAPPAATPAASSDFDDAALVEDASYDSGEDYVMQLGGETAESTAIGSAPEPPPPARGKRW